MLNERVNQGTARVLKGDEFLTKEIIKSMTQKHKTCVGCLSFEEKNIDENIKKELIESFENALLTDEMKGRYNILWVEHTDKGRLELNFIIPKIDLESKKSFNPYYHPADKKRIEIWGDFVNLCYGFTNPKDPAKEQTLQGSKKEKELFKDYQTLDKILHKQVADEVINSRDELISFLELNNIEITRKGKDYLSIKLPESKKAKRFKGSIYNEQFRSTQKLRELRTEKESRAREYKQRDIKPELERAKQELNKLIQSKSQYYRETIAKFNERLRKKNNRFDRGYREIQLQTTNDEIQNNKHTNELFNGYAYNDDFISNCVVSVDKALSNRQELNDKGQRRNDISLDTQTENERTREPLFLATQLKKDEIDNIRDRINSRSREITGENNRISTSRDEITGNYKNIRERFKKCREQITGLDAKFGDFEKESNGNRILIQARIERLRNTIHAKYTELRERIKNSFRKSITKVKKRVERGFSR